jgi:hypothetical protein
LRRASGVRPTRAARRPAEASAPRRR